MACVRIRPATSFGSVRVNSHLDAKRLRYADKNPWDRMPSVHVTEKPREPWSKLLVSPPLDNPPLRSLDHSTCDREAMLFCHKLVCLGEATSAPV